MMKQYDTHKYNIYIKLYIYRYISSIFTSEFLILSPIKEKPWCIAYNTSLQYDRYVQHLHSRPQETANFFFLFYAIASFKDTVTQIDETLG